MFNPFKKRNPKREIYFHEDDYCQQQIVPQAVEVSTEEELKKISAFSAEHQAPDGVGWTDVYVREEPNLGFGDLGLTKEKFSCLLEGILPRFDTVYTGYSSFRQECTKTAAWGVSEDCCIYADWDENEIIQNVWTSFFDPSEDAVRRIVQAVEKIGENNSLIYVDWAWDYTVRLPPSNDFERKLRDKLSDIEENKAKLKETNKSK